MRARVCCCLYENTLSFCDDERRREHGQDGEGRVGVERRSVEGRVEGGKIRKNTQRS